MDRHGVGGGIPLRNDGGFGAASLVDVAMDTAAETDFGRGFDEDGELVAGTQGGVVQGEDSFDDDVGGRRNRDGSVWDARVGGEVVGRDFDGVAGGEGLDVLGEEGGFEGVGMVEILVGAGCGGDVGEIAVVQVEGQERGGELLGEFAGEGGFAGAGTASNGEEEGSVGLGSGLGHRDKGNWSGRSRASF